MGMTIIAVIFGAVAIGLGVFCFINENFIKNKADDTEIDAQTETENKKK